MPNLKILTLNLHCLVEQNLAEKQQRIADEIVRRDIDIIFLQEVAQTQHMKRVMDSIKEDNYGYTLQQLLQKQNKKYYFYFEPIKQSFNQYDEGVGILSKVPLTLYQSKHISKTTDYNDWKSRKIVSYKLQFNTQSIYLATTHFGWSDGNEIFERQVDLAMEVLPKNALSIIAGDFNVTPNSTEYQYIIDKGFIDIFHNNPEFFEKPTHVENMDIHQKGTRIDYIMSTEPITLIDQDILFVQNPVSDHYGVYVEIKLN